MKRREFTKAMGAVAAALAVGSKVRAEEKPSTKAEKHVCKGHNSCKGKGFVMLTPQECAAAKAKMAAEKK